MQEVRIKLGVSEGQEMVFTKADKTEDIGLTVHTQGVDFHYAVELREMKKLHDFIVSEVFGPRDPLAKQAYESKNAEMNRLAEEMLKNG